MCHQKNNPVTVEEVDVELVVEEEEDETEVVEVKPKGVTLAGTDIQQSRNGSKETTRHPLLLHTSCVTVLAVGVVTGCDIRKCPLG